MTSNEAALRVIQLLTDLRSLTGNVFNGILNGTLLDNIPPESYWFLLGVLLVVVAFKCWPSPTPATPGMTTAIAHRMYRYVNRRK